MTKPAVKKRNLNKNIVLITPIYAVVFLLILGPLLYSLFLSFMTSSRTFGYDFIFTIDNYKELFSAFYLDVFKDSFMVALFSVTLIVLIGYPFGYFMARENKKWKKIIMFLIMLPFWTSGLIRLYGWVIAFRSNGIIDTILINIGLVDEPLKLLYSYPAVILGMVYALLPVMILSVYSSVEKMDWALVDAANDLGASKVKSFWDITFRMTLPGLLSGIILTFIPSMGLFFIVEILGGNKIVLVGNVIQELLTRGNNQPLAAAISVLMLIFTILSLVAYRIIAKTKDLEGI